MRALEHPLPVGMRDLLPEETHRRRAISQRISGTLERHGYFVVTPPAFEFADVLAQAGVMATEAIQFVEPESGEIAAFRPDITPQIARIIATKMRTWPAPYRLTYEGTVLRRRAGRARMHRQIPQVGVELAGLPLPNGDIELLEVATSCVHAAGLSRFTLDLGDAGIMRALLAQVEDPSALGKAIAMKDERGVRELATAARVDGDLLAALLLLPADARGIDEARKLVSSDTAARSAVDRLGEIFARARTIAESVTVDVGELRSFDYYTGTLFRIYAEGSGAAVVSGGRYDDLLARFGAPMPATGFAIDMDCLCACVNGGTQIPRHLVVSDDAEARRLRSVGVAATLHHGDEAAAAEYARQWGYSHLVVRGETRELV